jgi:hypothetical protein
MKKYYIYIFIVVVLMFFLGFKLVFYYINSSFVFLSYNRFKIDGDTIIDCNIKGGNIVIPSSVDGVVITKIGDYAFEGLDIDNIYIPDSIVSIGKYAFANNNIRNLKIPHSVKEIGEGAFIHNDISSLNIPSGVYLGNACFNDNKLEFKDSFFYRDSELISYGGSIKGNVNISDVSIIGEKAFFETYIVSVSISDSVVSIKDDAFKNNYLVEVYLHNNIEYVSESAFSNNLYLSEVIIDKAEFDLLNYPWGAENSNLYWLK